MARSSREQTAREHSIKKPAHKVNGSYHTLIQETIARHAPMSVGLCSTSESVMKTYKFYDRGT